MAAEINALLENLPPATSLLGLLASQHQPGDDPDIIHEESSADFVTTRPLLHIFTT